MIDVQLRLFGAFRSYSSELSIPFTLPQACRVNEFKKLIAERLQDLNPELGKSDLVFDSAIANEREVLTEEDTIAESCSLAILPPVCGG